MGTSLGKPYTYHSDTKYNKLRDDIKDLINSYEFWTNDKICERLSLVYYDKLIQFKKSDLLDMSASIGISQNNNNCNELCHQIINHYNKRIAILQRISIAINKTRNKILRAKKGPVCKNVDKYIDDFFECEKYNGLWLNEEQYTKVINKIKSLNIYDNWLSYIQNLDMKWKKYMEYLHKIVVIIKEDIDNTHDDNMIDQVSDTVDLIIKKIDYVCDIYYLLVVNYG